MGVTVLATDSIGELVLRLADGVLGRTDRLFRGAFRLKPVISDGLPDRLLDGSGGLAARAFDTVGAHIGLSR